MALYVGNSKQKLIVGKALQSMKIYREPEVPAKALLSSDSYILRDKKGTYLIAKDGE